MARELIYARGHPNIVARHKTTFEITKDAEIAKRADCIIAVSADKGAKDLSPQFKQVARLPDMQIIVDIIAEEIHERIIGRGHPNLTFSHKNDLVGRMGSYTCGRTLMIHADKAAFHLDRGFVKKIRSRDVEITIELTAEPIQHEF
ncbi:MAG: DUF371 domain-containing protein [Methanocellales archaeon]|nr:DUF371 domain-containing protein [Methanocellales archaeon]